MAQKVAWIRGAKRVIGVDIEDYRLAMAQKACGSETVNLHKMDPVEYIREITEGRGADVCIDAVGQEAERSIWERIANVVHLQVGSLNAQPGLLHLPGEIFREMNPRADFSLREMIEDHHSIQQRLCVPVLLHAGSLQPWKCLLNSHLVG
jgi:threonine dehydrogenase-like Zn-dependent dehydrogenase